MQKKDTSLHNSIENADAAIENNDVSENVEEDSSKNVEEDSSKNVEDDLSSTSVVDKEIEVCTIVPSK